MSGKSIAEREAAQLPELVQTPALDIQTEDVALARLHIGQFQSKAVQDGKIEAGSLYYSTGQDDPDPVQLEEPVTFHVLNLKKGKSFAEPGGPLQRFDHDDPDAPAGAWKTFDYLITAPTVDEVMPFKLLLTRTGTPAARQMNLILAKASVPHYSLAFELTTAERSKPGAGKYWIPVVRQVEAQNAHVKIAMDLAVAMSSSATETGSGRADSQPDI